MKQENKLSHRVSTQARNNLSCEMLTSSLLILVRNLRLEQTVMKNNEVKICSNFSNHFLHPFLALLQGAQGIAELFDHFHINRKAPCAQLFYELLLVLKRNSSYYCLYNIVHCFLLVHLQIYLSVRESTNSEQLCNSVFLQHYFSDSI